MHKRKLIIAVIIVILLAIPLCCVLFSDDSDNDAQITDGVLSCFEQLAAIPRPSHHEEQISLFLLNWAQEQGFDARQDKVGNVIFDVPACAGYETAPLTALQGHMDMVAVSDDPSFDPLSTPIKTVRGEDTLTADGTSLGADNGIGVATIMYYVTSQAVHGPLRVIITVNEEDGMTGVFSLDESVLADVSYLLNLDAETPGEIVISTAAGAILTGTQVPDRVAPALDSALTIRMDGLNGGHSGLMIDQGCINAIQHTADLLQYLWQQGIDYELSSMTGGTAANAIPNAAEAVIVAASDDVPRIKEIIAEHAGSLAAAYQASDAGVTVTVSESNLPETVFEHTQAEHVTDFASLVPDGVHTMSVTVDDLVESSSNLGLMQADADAVTFSIYIRSSQEALMDAISLKQQRLAALSGYETTSVITADAWPAKPGTRLQTITQEEYLAQTGEEAKLLCVHVGLECGTFARMKPDLDMVAIGPLLKDVHSVKETLYLDSVAPFYKLVEGTLQRLTEPE